MAAKTEKATETIETKVEKIECSYSKEQLVKAERFKDRKDLLNAILSDDKQYTIEDVEQLMDDFLKGKVK